MMATRASSTHLIKCLTIIIVCVNADVTNNMMPTVPESWIYAMIVWGFIASVILICVITTAVHKTYLHSKTVSDGRDKCILMISTTLNFAIWIFNAVACLEWALLRTDLFIDIDSTKCVIIYISNYLCYMLGKYCLHMLLLYRLYFAFDGTALRINLRFLCSFAVLITTDFIIFIGLWIDICLQKVAIGVTVPSKTFKTITFCTLYNNSSASELTLYQRYFPLLFGAQDLVVAISTLIIFIYKLNQLSQNAHDVATEFFVRKLFTVGIIALLSTFIFFTFAVPFYANLTFLLPIDALINGLCVLLVLDWATPLYHALCCTMEMCLQSVFKHEKVQRTSISTRASVILHGMHIHIEDKRGSYKGIPTNSPTIIRLPRHNPKPSVGEKKSIQPQSASCSDLKKIAKSTTDNQALDEPLAPLPLADSRFSKSSF